MKKILKHTSLLLSVLLLISCFVFPCNALKNPDYLDEDAAVPVNPDVYNYSFDCFWISIKTEYCNDLDEITADILECEYVSNIHDLNDPEDYDGTWPAMFVVFVKDANESNFDAAMQILEDKYYTHEVRIAYYIGPTLSGYYGDVNADGEVNANDARQIMRYAVKLDNIATYFKKIRSDVNKDGVVNAADARLALRMSVKLDELQKIIL